ncbi:MAG: hypothetical protein WBO06_05775 [Gammaproteobacteria bacterium]
MKNIEANNATYGIGKQYNCSHRDWRILTDDACQQWRNYQKPATDNGGEWRERRLPRLTSGYSRVKHDKQKTRCDNDENYVQHMPHRLFRLTRNVKQQQEEVLLILDVALRSVHEVTDSFTAWFDLINDMHSH